MAGPSSFIGVEAIRVSRLDPDGTPDFNNPTGAFMMCGGVSSFQYDWETNTGQDLYVEDARGEPCVIRKKEDKLKRLTFTLTLCRDDYRLSEILGDGDVDTIVDGSTVVGRAFNIAASCGTSTRKTGVAIELWSEQFDCDEPLADAPYVRTVLARAYLTPAGHTRENGVAAPVYSGYAVPNSNFGDGPFGDLDLLSGVTGWAMVDIDNDVVPNCATPLGYINIPGSAS